jgi:pilus assembly protein CpaB
MESVNKKVVMIALILSLLTTLLIYAYINRAAARPAAVEDASTVYVAVKTMPPKYKITEADIRQVRISTEMINSRAVLDKSAILGKRLKETVVEGEQIILDRLAGEEDASLSFAIPEGMRAVSINVNDQTDVSGLVRPGDFVDVVASFEREEVQGQDSMTVYPRITKIILQDVEILALGRNMSANGEQAAEAPTTATLAVSPQDAEKLVYASEYAILRLALRGAGDKSRINTSGIIREDSVPDRGSYTVDNAKRP